MDWLSIILAVDRGRYDNSSSEEPFLTYLYLVFQMT